MREWDNGIPCCRGKNMEGERERERSSVHSLTFTMIDASTQRQPVLALDFQWVQCGKGRKAALAEWPKWLSLSFSPGLP